MSDPDLEMFNRVLEKTLAKDNDQLHADNERLRAEHLAGQQIIGDLSGQLFQLRAEVERLKGELSYMTDEVVPTLRAEVDRLRASIAWTREVHTRKIAAGIVRVEMTREQFTTMRALAGKEGK